MDENFVSVLDQESDEGYSSGVRSLGSRMKTSVSALFEVKPELAEEAYLDGVDNTKILYRRYSPVNERNSKCSVLLVHGFGEHTLRFQHVVQSLVENNATVHTMDLRGHGLSGGGRADGHLNQFWADIKLIHGKIDPELPCFIYGHSMGGLLVLSYALFTPAEFRPRIDGVIATSPWIRLYGKIQPSWFKRLVLKLIGNMLDEFLITSNVDPCSLSNREKVANEAINDRMVLPFLTVRLAKELLKYSEMLLRNSENFTLPLLLIHGAKDRLTDHHASIEFVRRAGSSDKTARIFVNAYHEIHNDEDAVELLNEINSWIRQRCGPKSLLGDGIPHIQQDEAVVISERAKNRLVRVGKLLSVQRSWLRRVGRALFWIYIWVAILRKIGGERSWSRIFLWPIFLHKSILFRKASGIAAASS